MSSDRARISYDPRQQYRSVVMQQGRVTLEADWNESQDIASEEARAEALDFVGPAGTPDNGYAVSVPGGLNPFDFQVGPGTMYVGGMRASLPSAVDYSGQTEWLDSAIDPDFVPLGAPATGSDYVFLLLREAEVGGVEDADLKDVALGGPDTAQRSRLVQHVERFPVQAQDCAAALAELSKKWAGQGLAFDAPSMRLLPTATLLVGFVDSGGTPSPCDPVAQGGYLGADNQLIRVQIPAATPGVTALLWGFDDASFLYRVDVIDPRTLKLPTAPIDAERQPRKGQAVEVLMGGALLANGEYVAAPTGVVVTLTSDYDADARTIALPADLPAVYGTGDPAAPHPPRVFLRVWEQELPFTPGTPVTLGDTGVQVTLASASGLFHTGEFWRFAVRPRTPQGVYPERYLVEPQPGDGPREWVCPLAIIDWRTTPVQVLNCRDRFDNLVELTRRDRGGCCTVNVAPGDLTAANTLQNILDKFKGFSAVNVCLSPGVYSLTTPLTLTNEHSNFTIEGCPGAATLAVAAGSEAAFVQGMVILVGTINVAIRNLSFQVPQAPGPTTTGNVNGVPQVQTTLVSIGIAIANCAVVEVARCNFSMAWPATAPFFGAGIFGTGEILALQAKSNVFTGAPGPSPANIPQQQSLTGIFLSSVTVPGAGGTVAVGVATSILPVRLDGGLLSENTFLGLSGAVSVLGEIGVAEIASNLVRNCANGFILASAASSSAAGSLGDVAIDRSTPAAQSLAGLAMALSDPATQFALAFAHTFPLPANTDLSKAIRVDPATLKEAGDVGTLLQPRFDRMLAAMRRGAPAATAGAERVRLADVAPIRLAAPITPVAGARLDVAATNRVIDQLERGLLVKAADVQLPPFAVRIVNNDVSAVVTGMTSGFGLLVVQINQPAPTLLLSGNTITSAGTVVATVLIVGVLLCTVTGNAIVNDAVPAAAAAQPFVSLALLPLTIPSSVNGSPVAPVTVTGNIFRGTTQLPARSLSPAPGPPLDDWEFFNTLI